MANNMTGSNPEGQSTLDPALDAAALFQLAQSRPDLWTQIILHPNAYAGLLDWFKNIDQPQVQAALKERAAAQQSGPEAAASRPSKAPRPSSAPRPSNAPRPSSAPSPSAAPKTSAAPKASAPRPASTPQPAVAAQQPKAAAPSPTKRQSVLADPPRRATPASPFEKPTPRKQAPAQEHPAPQGQPAPQAAASPAPMAGAPQSTQVPKRRPSAQPAVDDKTVLARRKRLGYLKFNDETVVLTKRRVMVGRKLRGLEETSDVQLVRVADNTRTVSGTHAELEYQNGAWFVKDLDSTNGIYLVKEDSEEELVEGTKPVDGDFFLGDVKFSLSKDSQANG